jgi:hypothetical protein
VVVPKPGKPLFALPLNPNVVFVFVLDVVVVPKPGKPLFGLPLNPNVVFAFVLDVVVVPKPGKPLFGLPLNPNVVFVFVLDVVGTFPKPGKPLFGVPLNVKFEFVFVANVVKTGAVVVSGTVATGVIGVVKMGLSALVVFWNAVVSVNGVVVNTVRLVGIAVTVLARPVVPLIVAMNELCNCGTMAVDVFTNNTRLPPSGNAVRPTALLAMVRRFMSCCLMRPAFVICCAVVGNAGCD